MEPAASTPVARLRAVGQLAAAGIPVRAMIAPIVPGLTDSEIPALLEAVRNAGAHDARSVLLRLPLTVEPVFFEWLHRTRPECAAKVESQIRQTHAGKTNLSEWGTRMRGTGPIAEQIRSLFGVFRSRLGFADLPPLDTTSFRPPVPRSGQLRLF
jgi:DNA repair photolyase